ncbi:metal ABC transporter solute-binding protein, Zn/Mn family [Mesobacillus selenatarsenatis]|uniref:Zinc ABC transporter, periplasmic-binding protein ZnuA n=1 Tax=Mesobacillus selenatarsenatis (strain DSM 18680 / JCM 14380 / FERM P-15431 / SF-1) TaxID=1321606 RepID=A0A0A8XC62_MESS1|nr:zinc ABC transporter substrate-binding protein [Mesobacillus selenatarsenatis]GAM15756.1 zinc ABC transporter, periplasmic-binding protein ZnuA [Mesobacillus selenatarsenatis SF-1]
MKITKLSLGLLLLVGLTLAGCSSSKESVNKNNSEATKLTVYTTIYPLQDFAKKIGGEFVDVESIYPPNVDAHSFEPSTQDMMKLAEADLFIYSGAGIEGFAEKAEQALKNEKVMIVKAAKNVEMIESSHDHSHEGEDAHSEEEHHDKEAAHSEEEHYDEEAAHPEEEHHDEDVAHSEEEHHDEETAHSEEEHHDEEAAHSDENHHDEEAAHSDEEQHNEDTTHSDEDHQNKNIDPHVWLDPILSIKLASNIKDSLIELMPDREQEFEQNFAQLEKDLKELDNEFKSVIEQAENKHLLVAHEAYGYWSNRYGIIQIAVNGLSPTQEPSQRELTKLIEEAKEHDLKYIAFEQNVSSRVAEMIQREIGAETVTLYNLESISVEDMKNQEDYFSLMRKNLQTLEKVLN